MMQHFFLLLQICLFAFVSIQANPRQEQIISTFKYLTTQDGMGDPTITSLIQDKMGFIWFGTQDGLYKYDGNQIIPIRKNFLQRKGRGNSIDQIEYDSCHEQIWLLVENHLFSIDLRTEKIKKIDLKIKGNILCLFSDSSGQLWISVEEHGVYTYDATSNQLKKFTAIIELQDMNISDILQEKDGTITFLSRHKGLYKYHLTNKIGYHSPVKVGNAYCFTQDHLGNYWIGTMFGLHQISADGNHTHSVPLDFAKKDNIFAINKIVENSYGLLYIGSDSGLYTYDIATGKTGVYKAEWQHNGALNCNYINDLYIDREQNLWVATFFGGINFLPNPMSDIIEYDFINEKMAGHVISSFAEDEAGNLWIGTEDAGISCYNAKTQEITNYNSQNDRQSITDFHNVQALLYDNGLLYIGLCNSGVNIYHPKTRQTSKIRGISTTVKSFSKMADGKIAIGTIYGMNIYNPETNEVSFQQDIPAKTINKIFTDTDETEWVLGGKIGIYFREKGQSHFKSFNNQLPTTLVYTGTQLGNRLYFGTRNHGLIVRDLKSRKNFSLLTEELGNHYIYNIIAQDQCLWISTSNGIYQYHVNSQKLQRFNEGHGLKSIKMDTNAGILTHDSILFVGTINGLNGFRPQQILYPTTAPQTIFTNLRINNELVKAQSSGSPLKFTLPYTHDLVLPYNHSSFSISFSAMSYTHKDGVNYKYRLFPDDKTWDYTIGNYLNIKNMHSGEYTLVVKSCNGNGIWDEKGTSLHITILPPWWKSPGMLLTYALLLAISVFLFICYLRKRQERHIEKIKIEQQQKLYHSKMEFFTHIIHDIRTPLTLILSPLQKIMNNEKSQYFHSELEIMQRNGEHLLNNVNQLMDFQKSEQGNNHYEQTEQLDLVAETSQLLNDFRLIAEEKKIRLLLCPEDEKDSYITKANREGFIKIFTNLIANAVKFTRTTIAVHISKRANIILISIQDDGKGMSEEQQKTIFEPFFQVRDQLPNDNIGTGIGLAIVKNMAEKMKIKISLQSIPGKGTTFTLALPVLTPTNEFSPKIPQGKYPPKTECPDDNTTVDDKKWTIFIAEDNTDLRKFLISIFEPNYNVHDYPNGQELMADLQHYPCDLIISDIMMPVLDGIQLCNQIKSTPAMCHIPVVLLTAKVMETDEINGLEQGADAYIHKPFSIDLLLAKIKNLLKNRELISLQYRKEPETQLIENVSNEEDAAFIKKLDEIIAKNLNNDKLNSSLVSSELCMCRTLFFSKIKAISGMTFSDYIRVKRLKYAVEMMKTGRYTFNEISEILGFSSPSFFTRSFKKQFDLTPTEYLKQIKKNSPTPEE